MNRSSTKHDTIQDVRFQRAETLPQFRKLKQIGKEAKKHTTLSTTSNDNKTDSHYQPHDDDDDQKQQQQQQEEAIDSRFAAIYTDTRFSLTGDVGESINKHGRIVHQKKKESRHHKKNKYKEPEDDTLLKHPQEQIQDDNNRLVKKDKVERGKEKRMEDDSSTSSSSSSLEMIPQDPESRIKYLTALSRGELSLSSSSNDDDESYHSTQDDDDSSSVSICTDKDEETLHTIGILDPSHNKQQDPIELTYESSRFMAICNMDWTSVRAVDLFVILSSFVPPGSIQRVGVYPSDFGMEHMKKDYEMGPQGIWKMNDITHPNISGKMKPDITSGDSGEEESAEDFSQDDNGENDFNEDKLVDTDLDPEKLRAYEASKMKYYFAVAEFASTKAADAAYKELDGVEVGHSSATIDLRSIPEDDVHNIIFNRTLRDEATHIPSKYVLPDFVVAALQQTSVRCTWDEGDKERERLLTAYNSKNGNWLETENDDDLRVYLASDASSSEDDDEELRNTAGKGSKIRALLGLDHDVDHSDKSTEPEKDDDSFFQHDDDDSNEGALSDEDMDRIEHDKNGNTDVDKEVKFIPGMRTLEDKIRSTINQRKVSEGHNPESLTPWEQYQLKRKEKKREKKLKSKELKESFKNEARGKELKKTQGGVNVPSTATSNNTPSSTAELDLLLAGDDDDEDEKDFDMRGITRLEKNKNKKLKGSRKRKEMEKTENLVGVDFKIDATDHRFSAMYDERFGIDVTDPHYKDTQAMREILAEQSKRRKDKRLKKQDLEIKKVAVVGNVNADAFSSSTSKGGMIPNSGAIALSNLVMSLKTKVAKK